MTWMSDIRSEIEERTIRIERIIESVLPVPEGFGRTVIDAMNYSVSVGGKRLRPMLMQECYCLFSGRGGRAADEEVLHLFMSAIECIHTYSLVHDDLPAMDNDEYRRGKHTTWKKYGEGMGVLAGDALLNYAFETALTAFDLPEADGQAYRLVRALRILAEKAGIYGMIGGQTVDVESENLADDISFDKLMFIHAHKTAALLEASMMAGAYLAGADEQDVDKIRECARNIGIAFQIRDDILDVTGDAEELGKSVGSDANNHKQTYVTIKGLKQAAEDVEEMSDKAVALLESMSGEGTFLVWLVRKLVDRRK